MSDHWMSYGVDWWMWVLMALGIVGFWAVVAVVVRSVVQVKPTDSSPSPTSGSDPLRLLDERLARGEIDGSEYQHTRNLLRGFR